MRLCRQRTAHRIVCVVSWFYLIVSVTTALDQSNSIGCTETLPLPCACTDKDISCVNGAFKNTDYLNVIGKLLAREDFRSVDTVNVSGNTFTNLTPGALFGMGTESQFISTLNLSNNHIENVNDQTFADLKHVEVLVLSHNSLVLGNDTKELFKGMTALQQLYLNDALAYNHKQPRTQLDLWARNLAASNLERLEYIDLQSNNLNYLPFDFFCNLPNIQHAFLQDNMLRTFAHNAECLRSIQELHLSDNSIDYLGKNFTDFVDGAIHLDTLTLARNPFNCDCHLAPFVEWFQAATQVRDVDNVFCSEAFPVEYKGKRLSEINPKALRCLPDERDFLHTHVYVVVGLVFVGLVVLLCCIAVLTAKRACKGLMKVQPGPIARGYFRLGREPEVSADFV